MKFLYARSNGLAYRKIIVNGNPPLNNLLKETSACRCVHSLHYWTTET